MITPKSGYPLAWPIGRPRTRVRQRSQFKVTQEAAVQDLAYEVDRLGGSDMVITTNVELRRDGYPRSGRGLPIDQGVAVYFTFKKKPMCFACDRWETIGENIRAIGQTVGALRGIERWGSGSMIEQAMQGFTALPAPEQPWQVLEVEHDAQRSAIEAAYKRLAARRHPDRPDGDAHRMARINSARDQMLERLQ
jgi:DnaJ domain